MDTLSFTVADGVGLLKLSRPKALNALNRQLLGELGTLLDQQRDAGLRALVITGEGQRAFAAGADIGEMAAMDPQQAEAFAWRARVPCSASRR
jgi:enoyl-CoA hydratase